LEAITDEATSRALKLLHGEVIIIAIAHRLSTVIRSDRILYLVDGKLRHHGNFESLKHSVPECDSQAKLMASERYVYVKCQFCSLHKNYVCQSSIERLNQSFLEISAIEPPFGTRVLAVTPVGNPMTVAFTVSRAERPIESVFVLVSLKVTTIFTTKPAVAVSPTRDSGVYPFGPTVAVKVVATADVGIPDITVKKPELKAESSTSTMRLRVAFVDMFFLSTVEFRTIPYLGLG
jgi:hypothetical protein